MWTPTTRMQHIRETNRYQTDVTDKEWCVSLICLLRRVRDGRVHGQCVRSSTTFSMWCGRAVRGVCGRAICRLGTQSIAGLRRSTTRVASRKSTTLWSCAIANGSAAKPVPQAQSSTARASKRPRLAGRAATMPGKRSTGALCAHDRRFHPPRHDPHHAQAARGKSLVMNLNFPDGL
jgi:hypothetical protein